jgi:hypothetical protein
MVVNPDLRPWKGASLQVVQTGTPPKFQRIMAWIPDAPVETVNILRRLQSPNLGFKTGRPEGWALLWVSSLFW